MSDINFFSQFYTHNLLLISFQTLSVLNYCNMSWLSFSLTFIFVVFSLILIIFIISASTLVILKFHCFVLKIFFNCAEFIHFASVSFNV